MARIKSRYSSEMYIEYLAQGIPKIDAEIGKRAVSEWKRIKTPISSRIRKMTVFGSV
jgi:hypothetical protein